MKRDFRTTAVGKNLRRGKGENCTKNGEKSHLFFWVAASLYAGQKKFNEWGGGSDRDAQYIPLLIYKGKRRIA